MKRRLFRRPFILIHSAYLSTIREASKLVVVYSRHVVANHVEIFCCLEQDHATVVTDLGRSGVYRLLPTVCNNRSHVAIGAHISVCCSLGQAWKTEKHYYCYHRSPDESYA